MADNFSPLAKQVPPATTEHVTTRRPWGLLLHTTGRTIVEKALRAGRSPLSDELALCARSQSGELHGYKWGGPGYVLNVDGQLYQIAPDNVLTAHAGGDDRDDYIDGDWVKFCAADPDDWKAGDPMPEVAARWFQRWPGVKHPYSLFPSKTPNADYVGVEMIPCIPGYGVPMGPGLLFTSAQHQACVELARDMGVRHGWPPGWAKTARFLGHEDVQPIERHDRGGGWDPGFLRVKPYFDFAWVKARV